MSQFERYAIDEVEPLCPDTKLYRLRPLGQSAWGFVPGQFVFIHILDEQGNSVAKRPFSIASAPGVPYLEFCIKLIHGTFTGRLESLGKGAVLGVEKPAGHFTFDMKAKAGFIAGGTGIAPIISMLRLISMKKMEGRFVFFYSVKTEEHILYREELERLGRENPGIEVVITLTRDEGGWKGERGRVDAAMIARHLPDAKGFSWWICGPTVMVKDMRMSLESLGADPKSMKMEGWG